MSRKSQEQWKSRPLFSRPACPGAHAHLQKAGARLCPADGHWSERCGPSMQVPCSGNGGVVPVLEAELAVVGLSRDSPGRCCHSSILPVTSASDSLEIHHMLAGIRSQVFRWHQSYCTIPPRRRTLLQRAPEGTKKLGTWETSPLRCLAFSQFRPHDGAPRRSVDGPIQTPVTGN